MKLKHLATLTLLALGATALAAHGQDDNEAPPDGGPGMPGGPGGPGRHHRPPPLPIVSVLDANHDGVIDASEIASASTALLKLDKNSDGVLSTNEYLPPIPPDAPTDAPRPHLPPIVKALDANGDGTIDASEIANASVALKTLDKNGDGELSRDEYIGKHPGRPPRGMHGENQNEAGGPPDGGPMGPPPADN